MDGSVSGDDSRRLLGEGSSSSAARAAAEDPPPQGPRRRQAVAARRAVLAAGALVAAATVCLAYSPRGGGRQQAPRSRLGDVVGLGEKVTSVAEKQQRLLPLVTLIQTTYRPEASLERGSFQAECHMSKKDRCPFSEMPRGRTTAVYPGKDAARCILESSSPFLFQVMPGDADRLLIHFDLGGSCWEELSMTMGLCLTTCSDLGAEGIFNRSNPQNPYASYTVVVISYCSGDVHVGNVQREWESPDGHPIVQNGYRNTKTAVDWALANFGGSRLRALVVTGSSAGSLGAQVWARKLLTDFQYESAAVIADSFAGVFPPGVQGRVQQDVGLCTTGLLSPAMQERCDGGILDVQSIWEDTMQAFPEVTFVNIDGKIDHIQSAFYEAIMLTLLDTLDFSMVAPQNFYQALAAIYRRYNAQPNWVSYMVNSDNHMFLPKDILYRTRPGSTRLSTSGMLQEGLELVAGIELTGRDTPLTEWLGRLPLQPGGAIQSECRGVQVATRPPGVLGDLANLMGAGLRPAIEAGEDSSGLGKCDPGQADKAFARGASAAGL